MENRQAWGFLIIWEFHIPTEQREAFEHNYGPEGTWASLFRRSPEYVGSELARDDANSERYFTLDYWTGEGAFERFKEANYSDYVLLDIACEQLTTKETRLGTFSQVR
jgi:hypothetical protein